MTQYLPTNLLALFAPRDPIPYLPPVGKLPHEKYSAGYTGIAAFVNQFEDPKDTPPPLRIENREERQERKRKEKAEQIAYQLEQDIALWTPNNNPSATTDPYKTLFVARINYDTSEAKLRREFEMYGNIKNISIIHNTRSSKPRGYAFIEYEREKDMHSAYKHADGQKIDDRRVLVDVERGRTVKGWLPRRLGGGLGGTRRGGPEINVKHSGREEPEDRYMYRDRTERPERRRSRSRSRERRRRNRSRSRDRHRTERRKRERSRDRDRVRERDVGDKGEVTAEMGAEGVPAVEPRKERHRSRSRDRKRSSRRSRSKDRKRRDHEREREGRRERDRPRDQDDRMMKEVPPVLEIKQKNFDNGYDEDYNNYNNNSMEVPMKYESY